MITKFYTWVATGTVTSLLLATLAVAPVSAQSASGNGQGSGQDQSQNQGQGMNQSQSSNQGQGSCAVFAQSLGQGMSQGNNQNGSNGQTSNNSQAALGTGPGNAATPLANCWLSIGPGQKQWYKFHVGARSNKGDENNNFDNANGVDDSDAAIVQLAMDTPGCVAFEIWTLARLNAPPRVGSDATSEEKRKDKEVARGPVGAGSPEFAIIDHANDNNRTSNSTNNNPNSASSDKNQNQARLIWRGGSTVSENFYIAVRNLRSDFACTYRLSVAGPTVSFPGANNGGNNVANGSNNGNSGNNNGNNGENNGSNNNGGSNSNNNG
ncbi:MAG: hypothetical protein U0350_23765 [Caldilineaceae bacterium]